MPLWVVGLRVLITRFLDDEPQPGLIRCEFVDAHGRSWTFTEKTATVSREFLDRHSDYPLPGVLGCEVVGRPRDGSGGEVVAIATGYFPDGVETDEATMRFEVSPRSLVECEWESGAERTWSGSG